MVTVWLFCGSALCHQSLVQSPLSVQRIKTVQWPKHLTHSLHFLFLFFAEPSLCITDLRLRKSFDGNSLTLLWVSSLSPISCTKSTLCSAYKDSPVAETLDTLAAFPFPLFCGTKSLHHRFKTKEEICWVNLTPLWRINCSRVTYLFYKVHSLFSA